MPVTMRTVRAADGRRLSVATGGDPDGKPVVVCHGTPGGGVLLDPWLDDAAAAGIHLITYDRPGYGGSAVQPGRTVADCADDVRAIAFGLRIRRMAVWGISGGGPHALACAALMPDLICAAATIGSIAPYQALGDDWSRGMGESNVEEYALYFSDPDALRANYASEREALIEADKHTMLEGLGSLISPEDLVALRGGLDEYLAGSIHTGLARGADGWWDDTVAEMESWGFDLSAIEVPVSIWHGLTDQFVPAQHAEWLADNVPGAEVTLGEHEGHLTWLNRLPEIHERLFAHF